MGATGVDDASPRRALVLAGGWMHPAADPIAAMRTLLTSPAWSVTTVTSADAVAAAAAEPPDLLVVASCWFSMAADRYTDAQRAGWAVQRDDRREAALEALADDGVPVLALHTGVICFDGWPAWRRWLGGAWSWERSWHPEPRPMRVEPEPGSPIEVEAFEVVDEEYTNLDVDDVTVVARSAGGEPLVWLREADGRRAAVSLLGHDARSYGHPGHRRLLADLVGHLVGHPAGDRAVP